MNGWIRSSHCSGGDCVEINYQRSSHCAAGNCIEVGYRKSSFCHSGGCVEIGHHNGHILVRDTKNPNQPPTQYSHTAWTAFVEGVRNGEFDHLVGVPND